MELTKKTKLSDKNARRGIISLNKNMLTLALLVLIFLLGLSYRLIFAKNISFENLHDGTGFGHDEYYYNQMAQNIVEKGFFGYMSEGQPNAYVTPGYPVFLALIYFVFGSGAVYHVKVIQAILSAICIIFIFLIGKKTAGNAAGLIAALFVSLYPPLMFYSRFLLTETLYIFFFLAYFLMQIVALDKGGGWRHFSAGLLFAAAVLVRPLIFALLPLPYIYQFFADKAGRKKLLTHFAFFAAGFLLLMAPWWIRNIITLKRFVFLCTQSNPFYYGIIKDYATLAPSDNETADGIRLILQNLMSNPIETIKWYTIGKINIIFGRQDYWVDGGHMYLQSASLLHSFILAIGTLGAALSVFRKEIRLIAIFMTLNISLQLLFIPVERYAVPIMPLLSICAAYVICFSFRAAKRKDRAIL